MPHKSPKILLLKAFGTRPDPTRPEVITRRNRPVREKPKSVCVCVCFFVLGLFTQEPNINRRWTYSMEVQLATTDSQHCWVSII